MGVTFGEFYKQHRRALGLSLRGYCRKHGFDPGNISKIERNRSCAPQNEAVLRRHAGSLGLKDIALSTFYELAAISAGRIPKPLTDKELAAKLPVLFDIGKLATEDDLRKFAEFLRERL